VRERRVIGGGGGGGLCRLRILKFELGEAFAACTPADEVQAAELKQGHLQHRAA
jgi:hypothetical protein